MDLKKLKDKIQNGKFMPVLLLHGEEDYFIDHAVRFIIDKGVDKTVADFNLNVYHAESVDGEQVIQIASSYPMMAERRIVVVKSVQKFGKGDRDRMKKYVESPLESTTLVLTAGKIDKRVSFFRTLVDKAESVECKKLYEDQAQEWVISTFRQSEISITREAAAFLVEHTGTGLWSLHHEIEKTKAFAKGVKSLNVERIGDVIGYSRNHTVWDLTDEVAAKNLERALEILDKLLGSGHSPAGIIIDLARRMQEMLEIKALLQSGVRGNNIHSAIGMHPFRARKLMEQQKNYDIQALEQNIDVLTQSDLFIKTGIMDAATLLALTLHQLIRGKRVTRGVFSC